MLSHILALGWIQSVRCLLGLASGCFLVYRSSNIPLERRSRLEEGDVTIFLAAGIVLLALAVLRGVQGIETVRAVRRAREADRRRRGKLAVAGIAVWALAMIPIVLAWLAPGRVRWGQDVPSWIQWGISTRLALLLGWLSVGAVFLALRLFRCERGRLRRLGIVMAVIDVVDLTGFPFTTAAGTYGLLVFRHPDTVDFFEGTYSARESAEERRQAA